MKTASWTIGLGLILIGSQAWAHGDHTQVKVEPAPAPGSARALADQKIDEAYVQRIKPIFMAKCFDCHSDQTRWPRYYRIPGIKQFIDSDVREGREHLDFSKDYPFVSHATPIEDLDAIRKEIDEGEMPPFMYRLAHRDSALKDDEKRLIFDWIDWSKSQISKSEVKASP